ncbi:uncharacterized protein LOC110451320 [Mizuhopecten yessoensis]|uniref:uncharacterized protein LOC110451320 n=1 Tax=Mizuhopecten yessoensis TaxID=6573 RepID=UPI000B4580D4|nr:uncharacterized protein LOC110451320 [Mizuhopecten yessoensis]
MLRIVGLVLACVVVISYTTFVVEAVVRFRKCILYFQNENLPEIENGDRFCYQSERIRFCRETSCPTLSCDNPQPPSIINQSNCQFCPGQCVHGGKVQTVKQQFRHTDGVNYCTCHENNMITCSKLPTNEQNLCN